MKSISQLLNDVIDQEGLKTKVSLTIDQPTLFQISKYTVGTVTLCTLAFFGLKALLK